MLNESDMDSLPQTSIYIWLKGETAVILMSNVPAFIQELNSRGKGIYRWFLLLMFVIQRMVYDRFSIVSRIEATYSSVL